MATEHDTEQRRTRQKSQSGSKQPSPGEVAVRAGKALHDLTGRRVEGVTAIERDDDGWKIHIEVVELHRIPETSDLLGMYEVQVDRRGDLSGYRRLRRYSRGHNGEDPV